MNTEPSPTIVLEEEHRIIEKVASVMTDLARELATGNPADADTLYAIVDFLRAYADKMHHAKEEAHLFPALLNHGVPAHGCPVGVLIQEHEKGRTLVSELKEKIARYQSEPEEEAVTLAVALQELAAFYHGHIWKEDFLLFPMTHKVLPAAELQRLRAEFEGVDALTGREALHCYERVKASCRGHEEAGYTR